MGTEVDPPTTPERQVLVVGSGVDGLTTAAFLDQRGLSPVVVSPSHETPPTHPTTLWPLARALLASVDAPLGNVGTPIRQWELRRSAGTAPASLASAHGEPQPVVAVDRSRLREQLRDRLPPGCLRLSKTPCETQPVDGGLLVDFADGVRERFDVVVGADGPRSWLRRVRFDEPPAPWGTATWTLAADTTVCPPETVAEVYADASVLSCGPYSRAVGLRLVAPTGDDPDTETIRRQLRELATTSAESLTDPPEPTVVDRRTDHVVPSERWATGHTALVGRAARSLPPGAPIGPSLAVEDAYVLAAELAVSSSAPASTASALDAYAQRRRARHRSLARHAPLEDRFRAAHRDPVAGCWSFRQALLRSLFAASVPSVSAADARHL